MPDVLSSNPNDNDTLAAPVAGPVRVAMADFPPGKTNPSKFLDYERRPADLGGGAPRAPRQFDTLPATTEPPSAFGVEAVSNAVRNAAKIIAARQGGIGTVHIGDIKALLQASGVSARDIDAAIHAEAQAGRASLARTSSVKITDQQRHGGLDLGDGDYFHTVTFK